MRSAVAALLLVACAGSPVEPPRRAPAVPPAARDPDLARMPDDVWAIGAVDLTQLRESTARRWIWQLLAARSPVASRCRDELAAGTRVTVGLREREHDRYSSATFAIVHGIDRAAMMACLHGGEHELPELPPNHAPCDRFDAAVHALAACGEVPLSHAGELHALVERLASDGEAACPAAASALEAANARRLELGWTCRTDGYRDRLLAHVAGRAIDVDRDTVALGDFERVHFVDDHTLEIGSAEAVNGAASAEAAGKVLAELRPSAKARWFEASARTIDRTRGAWIVADLHDQIKEPVAVAGSVGLGAEVALDLLIANAPAKLTNEAISIAERALADPLAADVHVALGCSPVVTPPRTPKYLACEAAEDHLQLLETTRNVDPRGLLDERAQRCVADSWPADYVACLAATVTIADWDRCYQQLSAGDRERIEAGQESACGTRAFHVHVTVPDKRVEALKLVAALDGDPKRDCRAPIAGAPSQLVATKTADGKRAVRVCFMDQTDPQLPRDTCALVPLDDGPGSPDARWLADDVELPGTECVGPITFAPTLQSPNGRCESVQPGSLPAFEQRPALALRASDKGASICEGKACAQLPSFEALAIASDGKLAAVRTRDAIETWDLVAKRRLGRFAVATACRQLSIAGGLIAVGCGAQSYLATPAGKRVAALGDVVLAPLRLAPGRWGFASTTGDVLVAYDGASGKEQSRVALPHAAEPGMIRVAGDGEGRVVVAYGGAGKDRGAIAVVDATGVRSYQQSACPSVPPTPAGH